MKRGNKRVDVIVEVCSHKLVRPSPKSRGPNQTTIEMARLRVDIEEESLASTNKLGY